MKKNLKTISKLSVTDIEAVANLLDAGDIAVYPTETCYGLGCLVSHFKSIERLFTLKGRPLEKTFPVLFPSLEVLQAYVSVDLDTIEPLTDRFWPGPLTLILPATEKGRKIFPSRPPTLAVRISSHPFLTSLFHRVSIPLISTSANLSGSPPIETADQAFALFSKSGIGVIVDGGTLSNRRASTIVDLSSAQPKVLREGLILRQELLASILHLL